MMSLASPGNHHRDRTRVLRRLWPLIPLEIARQSISLASCMTSRMFRFWIGWALVRPRSEARIIGQTFPELEVVQITVLVNDFEAEDMFSYTAWFRPTDEAKSISKGHFVSAAFRTEDILIAGRRWIGEDLERIL